MEARHEDPPNLERPCGNLACVILVVEDNDVIRTLVRKILESRGFLVLEARDGNEGLLRYQTHLNSIDLILTDINMPNLGGRELAEGAWKLCPELKIIFMSTDLDVATLAHRAAKGTPFLEKPFTAGNLIDTVRQTLQLAA